MKPMTVRRVRSKGLSFLILVMISLGILGAGFQLSDSSIAAAASASQVVFAVNCGGLQYTDKSGIVYKADTNFSGGQTYKTTAAIAGTNDGVLYQSERYGDISYNVPVPNGSYAVTLKFAEIYAWTKGQRIFSAKIEGREVITNLDLFDRAGGKNKAYELTFPVTVNDGILTVEFYSAKRDAKVNAILVTSGQPVASYTITATAAAGGAISPSGAVSVGGGGTQTFAVTPNGGYQILDVKLDGVSQGATNTITVANVTANHTVEATFSQAADPIVTASAGVGGTIFPSGQVATHWGMRLNFAIAPNTGYRIADVKVDGVSQGAISYYAFPSVTANHTIEASFTQEGSGPQVVFAVNCGGAQYTDPSGVLYKADMNVYFSGGQTYKTTAPIAGTNDGVLYQSERYGNFSYNIPVPNGSYNVTLKFAEIYAWQKGQRVFSAKIEGQEVIKNLDLFDKAGGKNKAYDLTFPATVNDGMLTIEFITVVNSAKVNAIRVTSGQPISSYTITASAGAGGAISPSGAVKVSSGSNQPFTISPNPGYVIDQVLVDGVSQGSGASYTFPTVTQNHAIAASFKAQPQPVIQATAGPGGTISPAGQVAVAYGGQKTFTITPNSGYEIDQVIVDGVSKGAISSHTFSNVTANHTITAGFKLPTGLIGCTSGGIPTEYYDELCTPRALPVLVINYIPVGTSVGSTTVLRGPENDTYTGNAVIHCEETNIPDGCGRSGARMLARDRFPDLENSANLVAAFLTEATRFHGYQDPSAPPALTFQIVDTVTILQKQDVPNDPLWPNTLGYRRGSPLNDNQYRDPFRYIFETANICQYVKNQGVRLVFFNTYFYHGSVPAESFSAGPLGNVGNSEGSLTNYIAYCRNGAPVGTPQEADVTYHAIGYGPTDGTFAPGNSIEDFTHHLEALFRRADYNLWESRFVGPSGHQDKNYREWWTPGLHAGNYLNDNKVLNTWGLKIWVDAIHVPGDRSARLHIEPVPGVNPPVRNWPPGDTTPNVQMNVPFSIASDATIALEGKDIKINYWENAGWAFFNVYRPSADYAVVRRCGWTHYPPNGEGDYNWGNAYWRVRTDCEDWLPDQSGEILADVDCRRWAVRTSGTTCSHDPSGTNMGADLGFKKWWMQNIPGLDNGIIWNESGQTKHVRNFWYYITDYHRAIQKNSKLSFPIQRIETSAPTGLHLARAANGIALTWAASQSGVDGYNVFRAVSPSGPFYRVNNVLVTTENYLDDFVLNQGTTYYYDVRSVKRVQSETGAQGSITFQ